MLSLALLKDSLAANPVWKMHSLLGGKSRGDNGGQDKDKEERTKERVDMEPGILLSVIMLPLSIIIS